MPDSHNQNGPAEAAPSKVSAPPQITVEDDPRNGNDALCFTPGFPGATFGAGVIHAYLAADRDPPQIAAGISLGTVSAAVMQRSYADLLAAKGSPSHADPCTAPPDPSTVEAARWKFFRKYLSAVTDRPFQVLWNGIPDPADFFADLPPIKDPVPGTITDENVRRKWMEQERQARRELYLLVKLGHWLAKLPIRISTIANLLVAHVRSKEKYTSPKLVRNLQARLWQVAIAISFILHIVRVPARFPDYKFAKWRDEPLAPTWRFHTDTAQSWFRECWRKDWARFFYGAFNFVNTFVLGSIIGLAATAKSKDDRLWYLYLLAALVSFFVASAAATFLVRRKRLFWRLGLTGILMLLALTSQKTNWPVFAWIDSRGQDVTQHWLRAVLFIFLLALGHLVLLGIIAKKERTERISLPAWWFHVRTWVEWLIQRPLFGWPLYFASWGILILLLLWTASLSLSSLRYLAHCGGWWLLLTVPSSLLVLFLTFSLGTWWIPMKGKFPFRTGPFVTSTLSVVALIIFFHTSAFNTLKADFKQDPGSSQPALTLNEGAPGQQTDSHQRNGLLFEYWNDLKKGSEKVLGHPVVVTIIVLVVALFLMALGLDDDARNSFVNSLFRRVEMNRHIIHDYHLNLALTNLFGENGVSPPLTHLPFPLLLVASPLQSVGGKPWENNQLWARPLLTPDEPELVCVLRAALAGTPAFDPYAAVGEKVGVWYKPASDTSAKDAPKDNAPTSANAGVSNQVEGGSPSQATELAPNRLDLVDGAVIRQNPLPALFNYIRRNQGIIEHLDGSILRDARVHVVYNVPTQAAPSATKTDDASSEKQDGLPMDVKKTASISTGDGKAKTDDKLNDIVDVALLSLRLAQRRDINLEIEQTNFIARLAYEINKFTKEKPQDPALSKRAESSDIFPIFADHISPPKELSFANLIAPKRDEVLDHAAAGCKAALEQLYSSQIKSNGGKVDCKAFLRAVRKTQQGDFGLPEICGRCDGCLTSNAAPKEKGASERAEIDAWANHTDFKAEFPRLSAGEPRIVFIASGGVFRGPFHVGMINAMLALRITPDLVVGASVGTLVGGALAATLAAKDDPDSLEVLGQLVETFQKVDEQVAFTKSLKNAARELGLRGRMVDLSAAELRRKIQEGTESDPGFAVTGTPPVLIDAISDLLLIPHGATSKIAAEFVAGHFTDAVGLLVQALKKETLVRLGIDQAVMGTSLLEPAARLLLGSMLKDANGEDWYDLSSRQPYKERSSGPSQPENKKVKIALFATATDLCRQRSVLLGCYRHDLHSYDFVKAALASSAFPAVFSPRRESEIFPGLGLVGNKYSDGGMFDNLPITPALEILAAAQKDHASADPVGALGKRLACPDLFITGSLDVNDNGAPTKPSANLAAPGSAIAKRLSKQERKGNAQQNSEPIEFDNLRAIIQRTGSLQHNLKIKAFEEVSEKISEYLQLLYDLIQDKQGKIQAPSSYLNGLVNAVLLPVYPTDKDHLNGTFHFCDSLGRKTEVVNQSMADGCFQTMRELTISLSTSGKPARCKAVDSFVESERIPVLRPRPDQNAANDHPGEQGKLCPYFSIEKNEIVPFICPFSQSKSEGARELYEVCKRDEKHQETYRDELVQLKPRLKAKGKPA